MKPVIIVPGLGGSLLINIKKPTKIIFNKEVINNRWININPFSQQYISKWKEDMYSEFKYNNNNKIIGYNNYNKEIIPYDMFGINGIQNLVGDFELLNNRQQKIFERLFRYKYFKNLNSALINYGYIPKENLIGIPWDFRLLLDTNTRSLLFTRLKVKIERLVRYNKNRVVIVTHSLGGVLIKWFIEEIYNFQPSWIEEHIENIYLLNVPFGGSPSAIKATLIGDSYLPFTNNLFVDEIRMNSGIIMSLPNYLSHDSKDIFWSNDNGEQITLESIFTNDIDNISFKAWKDLYMDNMNIIMEKSNIPVTVINSSGVDTPSCYLSKSINDVPYKVLSINGDGIVTKKSLDSFRLLFSNYEYIELQNVEHTEIISHPIFLESLFDKLF